MKLSIYFQNVRGLRSKTSIFYLNLLASSYDIVCLNETFLNDSIMDGELFTDDYVVYRKDRNLRLFPNKVDGGGVLVAVHKKFQSFRITEWEVYVEELWIGLPYAFGTTLYINVPYISNARSVDYDTYFDNVSAIINTHANDNFILIGDFNIPKITWEISDDLILPVNIDGDLSGQYLIEMMNFSNMFQYNDVRNKNGRILDLIISNLESNNITVSPATSILSRIDEHHPPLELVINMIKLIML